MGRDGVGWGWLGVGMDEVEMGVSVCVRVCVRASARPHVKVQSEGGMCVRRVKINLGAVTGLVVCPGWS